MEAFDVRGGFPGDLVGAELVEAGELALAELALEGGEIEGAGDAAAEADVVLGARDGGEGGFGGTE